MSTVSTFGTFTTIKLGIYAASRGITVTGNNISNVNTTGYTRQQLDQASMYTGGADRYVSSYDVRIGGGVLVSGVSQLRDPYLDIQYRTEQSSVGAYEARQEGLTRLSQVIDEVCKGEDDGGIMEAQFNDLMEQLSNLVTRGAGVKEYDTLVRTSVESLCSKFQMYASQLQTVWDNQESRFKQDLDDVNSILKSIRNLNEQIRQANLYGSDALSLKDERNNLIDDLSKYMRISVIYSTEDVGDTKGVEKLTIKLDGDDTVNTGANTATLVDGIYCTQFSIRQVPVTDENGNVLYVKDDDGNFVLDENGDPIMQMQDSENFDLDMTPLVDRRGKIEIAGVTRQLYRPPDPNNPDETLDPPKYTSREEAEADMPETTVVNGLQLSYEIISQQEEQDPFVIGLKTTSEAVQYIPDGASGPVKYSTQADAETIISGLPTEGEDGETYNYEVRGSDSSGWYIYRSTTQVQTEFDSSREAQNALRDLGGALPEGVTLEENESISYEVVKKNGKFVIEATKTAEYYRIREVQEVLSTPVELNDNTLYGALQSERELLVEKGEYTDVSVLADDPNAASKRGIQYYQNALDALANKVAEVMNTCNGVEKVTTTGIEEVEFEAPVKAIQCFTPDGSPIEVQDPLDPDNPDATVELYLKVAQKGDGLWYILCEDETPLEGEDLLVGGDGVLPDDRAVTLTEDQLKYFANMVSDGEGGYEEAGEELHGIELQLSDFPETDITMYKDVETVSEWVEKTTTVWEKTDPDGKGGVLISNDSNKDTAEGITASNISVSNSWATNRLQIVQSFTSDNSTANDNYQHLLTQMDSGTHYFKPSDTGFDNVLNPDVAYYSGSLQGMLTNMNEQLANDLMVTDTMLTNYEAMEDELWIERDSVSGVDLNDEAINMMQYQKAYSASCRLMTTYDEMLEKLINGT